MTLGSGGRGRPPAPTPHPSPNPAPQELLTKFIFLSERLISADESEEGYRYESMRLQKLFGVTADSWSTISEDSALPFYQGGLNAAVLEGRPATAANLAAMQASLGVSASTSSRLHADAYAALAQKLLEDGEANKLSGADSTRLAEAATLLSLDEPTAASTLEKITSALYTSAAAAVISELEAGGAAGGAAKLAQRQQELLLTPAQAAELGRAAFRAHAEAKLATAARFLRTQNVPQATAVLTELLTFCGGAATFAAEAQIADEANALESLFGGVAASALKGQEMLTAYKVMVLAFTEKLSITADEEEMLARLRSVLELSEAETDKVYELAIAPIFKQLVLDALSAGGGAAEKTKLDDAKANLALPEALTRQLSVAAYAERLGSAVGERAILSEESSSTLAELRGFLGLELEEVAAAHLESCGAQYKESVGEVFKSAGAATLSIPDSYFEGLERLQSRLCLAETDAEELYNEVVVAEMKKVGAKAMEALEAKLTPKKADDKDADSMGMKAESLVDECYALISFAESAKVLFAREVNGKEALVASATLKGEFQDKGLSMMYQEYLSEAFGGKDANATQKLFDNLPKLGLVLGLTEADIADIHDTLGSQIFRRYLARALQTGGIGETEQEFLAEIQQTLSLPQAKCEQLVKEQKVQRVANLVEMLFSPGGSFTAEDVQKVRDTAAELRINFIGDMELPTFRLEKMFVAELEELVDTAQITPDNSDALIELCESLFVTETRATELLQLSVDKRMQGGLLQATALLRQQATEQMIGELDKMLKFAALSPGEIDLPGYGPSAAEKNDMYMLYQANTLTGSAKDEDKTGELEVLKAILSIQEGPEANTPTPAAVPDGPETDADGE